MYRFEHVQLLQSSPQALIEFFSDVANLNANTPSYFKIELLEGREGGELVEGQLFRYRFKIFGIGFPWVTHIDRVEPDYFVDSQHRGVYKSFRHTHLFLPRGESTLMLDRVDYELGYGPLNSPVNALVVRPLLQAIFSYRASRAAELFGERLL